MTSLPRRRLAESGLDITTLGLGTSAVGGQGWAYSWGPQDDRRSVAAMRRALELGSGALRDVAATASCNGC